MNRAYFNFCQGQELSRDEIGMYLPCLDAAGDEAIRACRNLPVMEEDLSGSAIQIADTSGALLLTIPCAN